MEYLIALLLTMIASLAIIKTIKIKENNYYNRLSYRQSDMHNLLKHLASSNLYKNKKQSQSSIRNDQQAIKVITVEDKAYWVVDNVFYVADMGEDMPDMSTAQPIDTSNMSKSDIDKMLFILDNLDRGKKDERGSTGNE